MQHSVCEKKIRRITPRHHDRDLIFNATNTTNKLKWRLLYNKTKRQYLECIINSVIIVVLVIFVTIITKIGNSADKGNKLLVQITTAIKDTNITDAFISVLL